MLRTTEPVFLSWVIAVLKAEAIEAFVLDSHTSVLEGSTNAIHCRLMVADEDLGRACRLLTDAGEGDRLAKRS